MSPRFFFVMKTPEIRRRDLTPTCLSLHWLFSFYLTFWSSIIPMITLRKTAFMLIFLSTDCMWYAGLITYYPLPKFCFVLPIVFSFRAHAFLLGGLTQLFMELHEDVTHFRYHDNRRINTSADVSTFKILPFTDKRCL
jgi:hypothetical protein